MKTRMLCMLLVLTMVLSMTPLAAISALAEDYPNLQLGEEVLIELEPDMSVWYQFVPEETAAYNLVSFGENAVDPRCNVFDSEMNLILEADDNYGANFDIDVDLTAGETYYFEFFEYDTNDEGYYSATLTKHMPTSISLNKYEFTGYIGCKFPLEVEFYPSDTSAPVAWTSSDDNVATVDKNGAVECVGEGNAVITATINGDITDVCEVTVNPSETISLNEEKTVTYVPKEQREIAKTFRFVPEESGTYRMYSYDIVSTTEDAEVDPRLWARNDSMEEIGYDDDGGEDVNVDLQCRLEKGKIYFFELEPYDCDAAGEIKVMLVKCSSAETITIDCGDLTATEGERIDIYVTLSPENCAEEDYTCTSSNTSVVKIDGKTAYFVGSGEATITVTSEYGLTDSITVTVNPINEIFVDTTYTLDCLASEYESCERYKFIPTESGVYRFESFNITGDRDPAISLEDLYDQLRYNYDTGEDLNFMLDYELTAGEVYYIGISADCDEPIKDGSVDFKVSKLDESDFPVLEPDSSADVIIDIAGLNKYFSFTPVRSGVYSIFSTTESSDLDTKMQLFDADWVCLEINDDGGVDSNYSLETKLIAGRTYYIKSFFYHSSEVGVHTVNIDFLYGPTVETTTVEDIAFTGDEVVNLEAEFIISDADIVDDPVLFLVNGSERVAYKELSYDSEYNVSYDFSGADFSDGVYTKTFVFGVCVDGEWHYSNEFTVSYTSAFSITFDANGGDGTMEGATVLNGDEYTLPENNFTAPAGMKFKAWSIDGVEKAVGDVIEISADIIVIAVWEDIIGDIDGDYDVDTTDYMLLKRYYWNTYDLNKAQVRRADVNKNGTFTAMDYFLLKRICFGTYTIE